MCIRDRINGGEIAELINSEAMVIKSSNPFKGNIDLAKLDDFIKDKGKENIAFIRMEASTNLIGGQPFSLENLHGVRTVSYTHLDVYKRQGNTCLNCSQAPARARLNRERKSSPS